MKKEITEKVNKWMTKLLFVFSLAGLFSCDTDDIEKVIEGQFEPEVIESQAEMEMNLEDIESITTEAMGRAFEETGGRYTNSVEGKTSCAEFVHDVDNKMITLDFGDGCEGPWGRKRSGKVIITYSGRYFMPGSVITTSLEDFYLDEVKIEGAKKVTNISQDTSSNPTFEVLITDAVLTWQDGTKATRSVDHIRTWIRNPNPLTDEFHIAGTAEGTSRKGQDYKVSISSELIYKVECISTKVYVPVKGVQLIERTEKPDVIVDYGAGDCDNLVEISVNGFMDTIDLSKD